MWNSLETAVRRLCLAALLAAAAPALAANSAAEIKAAFIYNFAKFVEWPRTAFGEEHAPLYLCIWGQALEGKLQLLNGREAQGHPIRVRPLETLEGVGSCHILVVGENGLPRGQLLQAVGRSPVLTIGEAADFVEDCGMIGLFVAANRVQFAVNLGAAQSAGLKMSARMLQLAQRVRGEAP